LNAITTDIEESVMTPTATNSAKPSRHTGLIAAVSLLAITLVVAVIAAKPGPPSAAPATLTTAALTAKPIVSSATTPRAAVPASTGALSARDTKFDFGIVSMAAGDVSHRYWFRNNSSLPVVVERIYTSCMCTTATLVKAMRIIGSFGMPGHGPLPDVNQSFAPGEAAYVDVVFDPAAHGPAGLGRTERVVSIESDTGQRLELAFVANVRP
jgi:hypothetical protein